MRISGRGCGIMERTPDTVLTATRDIQQNGRWASHPLDYACGFEEIGKSAGPNDPGCGEGRSE